MDEVDSILIDEARTPLIISGPTHDQSELYIQLDKLVSRNLGEEDYELDEKQRTVTLTEEGTERLEELLREAGLLRPDATCTTRRMSGWSITSTRRFGRTSCSSATRITSSATRKW